MSALGKMTSLLVMSLLMCAHGEAQVNPSDDKAGDQIVTYWSQKPKWYLVITASRPNSPRFAEIAWVDQDGVAMKKVLEGFGYQPLRPPMSGSEVSFPNVQSAIKAINDHKATEVVVVYFSGHGEAGGEGSDLELVLNDGSEMSLTNLVRLARGGTSDHPAYTGQLVFIFDACDSGNGIWLTDLKKSELQLPTVLIGSSAVNEDSRKLNNQNASAFTATFVTGATTQWEAADENHDGFLDYHELELWVKPELHDLFKRGQIDGDMHPEGDTEQPLFLHYDKSHDRNPNSVRRRTILADNIIAQQLTLANTFLTLHNGSLQPPAVPKGAQDVAALVPDSADLPLLSRGNKALAENRVDDARRYFTEARQSARTSPYRVAQADVGLARVELYAGNYDGALPYYEEARAFSPDSSVLAELGATKALAGNISAASLFLASADYMNATSSARTPREAAGFASTAQSLAITYQLANRPADEADALKSSLAAAKRLKAIGSSESIRAAAVVYSNAAEISKAGGDVKKALKFYHTASSLFDKLHDTSNEYLTMLQSYGETLIALNKQNKARVPLDKAANIEFRNRAVTRDVR